MKKGSKVEIPIKENMNLLGEDAWVIRGKENQKMFMRTRGGDSSKSLEEVEGHEHASIFRKPAAQFWFDRFPSVMCDWEIVHIRQVGVIDGSYN